MMRSYKYRISLTDCDNWRTIQNAPDVVVSVSFLVRSDCVGGSFR